VPRRNVPPESLELTSEQMRDMVDRAMDRIVPWIETIGEQPMHRLDKAHKLARALREPLPEGGVSFRRILGQLFERVLPMSLNTAGPGYLAYIPGGGLFHAAVADLIADATNRYVGIWAAAPGLVEIESTVIRWFVGMVGFPATGGGVLTSGGSIANLTAIVTARHTLLGEDFLRGTIYTSPQAHHSVRKAARIAGFPDANVREVPADGAFRLRAAPLEAALAADRAAGFTPAIVVASAGTTATGAVDPLAELADVCARERLWFHVDAAYGGFFQLTDRGRAALAGIERADSVTLDPHKGLFLPYGTGGLLVRDRDGLRRAHQVSASYLPPAQADPECWDFADLGPELSRDPRGLRVWIPLKMHGAATFRAALDEKMDLARDAAARLAALPGVEIVSEPTLSLFAFRVAPPGVTDPATVDAFGRRVLTGVNARQRVFLTGVEVDGRHLLRVCVLSFRTHAAQIDALVEDLGAAIVAARRASDEGAENGAAPPDPRVAGPDGAVRT
jgi:aromatic-L-amino-acid decarboxylase